MAFRVDNSVDRHELGTYFREQVNPHIPREVSLFLRKIDPPHNDGESIHAHMTDTSTLMFDGTWANGKGFRLPECVLVFLKTYNFTLPVDNDKMPEFTGANNRRIDFTADEIRAMSKGKELPSSMRKIDRAHNGSPQDHIHFQRDENDYEAILNKDGSWDPKLNRALTEEEKEFITSLEWTIPSQ
ncbi:MAG: hypothetical protein JSR46_06130 [Verrucomicrobia bacterium]|nr:hypothetical protein [Verrucomicrobiota bacterium]